MVIKSKQTIKLHKLQDSPFYKLGSRVRLAKILLIHRNRIDSILNDSSNYKTFTLPSTNRFIQVPQHGMKAIHNRINDLLSRIEIPAYVMSPKKGVSYIDNAKNHIGAPNLIKTDISKFYPSTTLIMIFRMFNELFECKKDIAMILAQICSFEQTHLPTGSPLSGRVAFFASKKMFDSICDIARERNCKYTLYVDDITISGQTADGDLLKDVRKIIHGYGFYTKSKKSKIYKGFNTPKEVTGVILKEDKIFLPNKRHKKIWETKKNYLKTNLTSEMKRYKSMEIEAKKIINF